MWKKGSHFSTIFPTFAARENTCWQPFFPNFFMGFSIPLNTPSGAETSFPHLQPTSLQVGTNFFYTWVNFEKIDLNCRQNIFHPIKTKNDLHIRVELAEAVHNICNTCHLSPFLNELEAKKCFDTFSKNRAYHSSKTKVKIHDYFHWAHFETTLFAHWYLK